MTERQEHTHGGDACIIYLEHRVRELKAALRDCADALAEEGWPETAARYRTVADEGPECPPDSQR